MFIFSEDTRMENNRSPPRPSLSNKRPACRFLFLSPPCRFCLCVGFLISVGFFSGIYFYRSYLCEKKIVFHPRRLHDSKDGKTSVSVKKPGAQFTDYLPRFVFVDVSTGPPTSLELFLETYPQAEKYSLYAFLADNSYSPLYSGYFNLTLYSGTVLATSDGKCAQHSSLQKSLSCVDFSAWLRNHVHPDETVIVKLSTDPETEEDVIRKLVETGIARWIDKFYTTTESEKVSGIAAERFGSQNLSVLSWDDYLYTYSDFDDINPPKSVIDIDDPVKITKCRTANEKDFTVLLYFSEVSYHSSRALNVLSEIAMHVTSIPMTIFFPLEYLKNGHKQCQKLEALAKYMELGLYLQTSSFQGLQTETDQQFANIIRNKLVFVEHCFARANVTLNYVLDKKPEDKTKASNQFLKKIISSRGYDIISPSMLDTTSVRNSENSSFYLPKMGEFLALDLGDQDSQITIMRLLNLYVKDIIPMQDCIETEKAAHQ